MINVKQKSLLAALTMHKGVADHKSNMPVLANVLLRATDGVLTLRTTNLTEEIVTIIPCDDTVAGELDITAPVRAMLDAVKACAPVAKGKAEGPVICLALADNRQLIVRGIAEMRLATMPAADFPAPIAVVADADALVTYKAAALRDALNFILPAVSTDETRYHLNAVLFDGDKMVSTDGHRLHKLTGMPTVDGAGKLLPRRAAFTLAKLLKGASEVQATFGPAAVHFGLGDTEFAVKLIDAKFPPYEQVIPRDCSNGFTANRVGFIAAINAASTMSSDRTWGVKLNTAGGELYVSSDNADMGEAKAPFQGIARSAEPWKIGVNAKYLLEALAEFDATDVEVQSEGELDPLRMDHDGRTVVVMPMRI